jgi:hypothetical protein
MRANHVTGGLIALSLGAGCGGAASGPPSTPPESPEKVEQSIQQSLDRIRALQVVDVSRLVLNLPAEATACYGLPCTEADRRLWEAERARQAPRVEKLASLAETAAHDSTLAPRDMSEKDAALKALAGLAVVEVYGLVETKPANNYQCYNTPCVSDVEAANRINGARVAQVFAIVDAAQKSGL